MKTSFIIRLGLIALVAALHAETPVDQPRTSIDSDTLEMQGTEDHNFFYFGGSVRVIGNDLDILCDELTVRAKRSAAEGETLGEIGAIEEIVAVGHVKITQAGRVANAGRVVVDPGKGTIHFLENPVIIQDDMRATAYGFIFYTKDKRLEAINPPGFVPGKKEGRSSISLSALPPITFDLPKEAITVGNPQGTAPPPVDDQAAPTVEPAPVPAPATAEGSGQ